MQGGSSSLDAEAYAIIQAMEMATTANWNKCTFETDCGDLFKIYMEGRNNSFKNLQGFKSGALKLAYDKDWNMSLIRREANVSAHNLAMKATQDNCVWSLDDAIPICVQ